MLFYILSVFFINNSLGLTPILLIPGFGGSVLTLNNNKIYPPSLNQILFNRNEWLNQIYIHFNDIENKFNYNKNIKTLEFGNKKALDLDTNIPFFKKKNIYNKLINDYKNIYTIPYDFRLIHIPDYLNSFYLELTEYIEHFDRKISIIAHSTGGIILHYFLTQKTKKWKDKYIINVSYINVPFCGLTISLIEMIKNTYLNFVLNKKIIKSFGGLIINLPNNKYIKPILLVDGIEKNYIEYFNFTKINKIININYNFINSFNLKNDVSTNIIYTSSIKTPVIIEINKKKVNILYGNGDGIVSLKSILHPMIWNQHINYIHIPLYEHSNILYSNELKYIIFLLSYSDN